MHSEIIPVALPGREYEVHVGAGLLAGTGSIAARVRKPGKCAILADSNTAPLFATKLAASLKDAGFAPALIEVPAGESSKSLSHAESCCDAMIRAGLDRQAILFALGGGVVGDLGGFVSAIFYRGIPYVQIPTTIVAQVDSSVGGKTGVNSNLGKNLIGAFHQPAAVIADTATLATLPDREFNEGFAEVVKHAVIRDAAMLDLLPPDRKGDLAALIARNVRIKADIVAADEKETRGLRALLNFGHTIGHAIENAAGYGKYFHGEAISLGTVAALWLSVRQAGLSEAEMEAVVAKLQAFQLPTRLGAEMDETQILAAMGTDKKFEAGAIRFVLTPKLGEAFVSNDVSRDSIGEAIRFLKKL